MVLRRWGAPFRMCLSELTNSRSSGSLVTIVRGPLRTRRASETRRGLLTAGALGAPASNTLPD